MQTSIPVGWLEFLSRVRGVDADHRYSDAYKMAADQLPQGLADHPREDDAGARAHAMD